MAILRFPVPSNIKSSLPCGRWPPCWHPDACSQRCSSGVAQEPRDWAERKSASLSQLALPLWPMPLSNGAARPPPLPAWRQPRTPHFWSLMFFGHSAQTGAASRRTDWRCPSPANNSRALLLGGVPGTWRPEARLGGVQSKGSIRALSR